jgi:hypothetical protein
MNIRSSQFSVEFVWPKPRFLRDSPLIGQFFHFKVIMPIEDLNLSIGVNKI